MTKKPRKLNLAAHFGNHHIPLLKELRLRELDEEYMQQLDRLRHILEKVKKKHLATNTPTPDSHQEPSIDQTHQQT